MPTIFLACYFAYSVKMKLKAFIFLSVLAFSAQAEDIGKYFYSTLLCFSKKNDNFQGLEEIFQGCDQDQNGQITFEESQDSECVVKLS